MLTEINSHCASNRLNIVRHKGNEWQWCDSCAAQIVNNQLGQAEKNLGM